MKLLRRILGIIFLLIFTCPAAGWSAAWYVSETLGSNTTGGGSDGTWEGGPWTRQDTDYNAPQDHKSR